MRPDSDKQIFHRANNSLGHFQFRKVENGVNGGDRKIQLGQNLVLEIEFAVTKDVALHTGEESKAIELLVHLPNRGALRVQCGAVDSVGLNRALAVYCIPKRSQAELLRGASHFLQSIVA